MAAAIKEALPYIARFVGKTVVVKIGGSIHGDGLGPGLRGREHEGRPAGFGGLVDEPLPALGPAQGRRGPVDVRPVDRDPARRARRRGDDGRGPSSDGHPVDAPVPLGPVDVRVRPHERAADAAPERRRERACSPRDRNAPELTSDGQLREVAFWHSGYLGL